jgi:hypothetical protein
MVSEDTLVHAASLWGAGLATVLAIFQIKNLLLDKADIKIEADITFQTANESDPEYGTRQKTPHGIQEMAVNFVISNRGRRAIQIVSIFIEGKQGQLNQVESKNLPAVLEGGRQITTTIQKEWLDDPETIRIGALDALGKRHSLTPSAASELIAYSRSLPSNRRQYRKKDDPTQPPIWAWQIRDRATLATRPRRG